MTIGRAFSSLEVLYDPEVRYKRSVGRKGSGPVGRSTATAKVELEVTPMSGKPFFAGVFLSHPSVGLSDDSSTRRSSSSTSTGTVAGVLDVLERRRLDRGWVAPKKLWSRSRQRCRGPAPRPSMKALGSSDERAEYIDDGMDALPTHIYTVTMPLSSTSRTLSPPDSFCLATKVQPSASSRIKACSVPLRPFRSCRRPASLSRPPRHQQSRH